MIFSLIIGFVLGAAAIMFALQNTQMVMLTFLGWQFESSLAVLMLITLATCGLISMLLSIPSAMKDTFKIMGLKKENKRLTEELQSLTRTETAVVEETVSPVLDIRN